MEDNFDLDQVQEWGEIALITLTQLWRQLPRIDNEAASKLSDQVVDARKSIEKLVKAACATTHRNLESSDALYEPLPYGHGTSSRMSRRMVTSESTTMTSNNNNNNMNMNLDVSPGNERGVSTFSHTSFSSKANGAGDGDDKNSTANHSAAAAAATRTSASVRRNMAGENVFQQHNNLNSNILEYSDGEEPDGKPYSPTNAVRAAAAGHVISEQRQHQHRSHSGLNNNNNNMRSGSNGQYYSSHETADYNNNNIMIDDHDFDPDSPDRRLFKTEIRTEGVPNIIFDDPDNSDLAYSLTGKGRTAHSKLALMVQFAERRETMWKNHAKFLQDRTELDEVEESEMEERYNISLDSACEREKIICEFSRGLPIILASAFLASKSPSKKSAAGKKSTDEKTSLLESVRDSLNNNNNQHSSPNRLKLLSDLKDDEKFLVLTERVDSLQTERNSLIEEMAKLSTECTRLSRENSDLAKKAQDLPPGPSPELEKVTSELSELRKKIVSQSERSRSISRTGSPAIEGGSYVPPQGGGAILQQQRSASAQYQHQHQQQFLLQQSGEESSQKRKLRQHDELNDEEFSDEEEEYEEEEEEEEESELSDEGEENDDTNTNDKPQKKITSVADAVLLLIKRQRKAKKEERRKLSAESGGTSTTRTKRTKRRRRTASRNTLNNNNSSSDSTGNQHGSDSYYAGTYAWKTQEGQFSPGSKLGNFGDDSLVPLQVVNASNRYFPKSKKKSSRRSTPRQTTPRETHLSVSHQEDQNNNSNSNQQQTLYNSSLEDPEFAELEKKNREILNRLKEEMARKEKKEQGNLASSQRSTSPYHRGADGMDGSGSGAVVSRSVAFLKKQHEQEEAARHKRRIQYAFGTPVREPLPPPSGKKPQFSKFYSQEKNQSRGDSLSPDESAAGSSPGRSLGYLKWQYRKDQQQRKSNNKGTRRSNNNNSNEGNKTPPAPSLNAVTVDSHQIRLDAVDDDEEERTRTRTNITSSSSTLPGKKQQIQVRSVGKGAQAPSASSSTLVKKPVAKPSGTKIVVPAPSNTNKQQQQQQQKKTSDTTKSTTTTALEALANEESQPREEEENHLQSLVFEREVRVVIQSERAERADILSEAATYYTNQASALGKESLDWLETMKSLREE